jgi:amidophosphoribosyltransferase
VLQPQAPQRLGPRSGPDGGLGVVRCSRAVGATRLRLLASHTLTSTRRKLIGRLQLPTGDGQPDRRVALHTHRNVAYRSDVTNHRKWTLWRLLSILQESLPGWPVQLPSRSDTDVMAELLAREADLSLEEAIARTMPRLEGAFSLVIMDERTLYGVRDRHGIRPLCIGKLPGGWVIASETAALDIVGATLVREVEPGEVVAIDEQGLRARRFAPPDPRLCVFEHVYLARADSTLAGQSVHQVRRALGAALAVEAPVEADLVIPVPDTAWSAAAGYAEASGIPFGEGLMKNRYVGRTFIQPSQTMRQLGIRIKLNPLREAIRGLRLVVVDDSIVRGNTTKAIVAMLREAGAHEVHVRITSPPVRWPCFYGIDMPTRAELVASDLLADEVASYLGADSLGYLSLEALTDTAAGPGEGPGGPGAHGAEGGSPRVDKGLCTACFTGSYPIPVQAQVQGKELLEGLATPR